MFQGTNRPGQQPFENKRLRVVNRGGATALVVGDLMAVDIDASDAATQALSGVGGVTLAGLEEAVFHNIVNVAAGPLIGLVGVVTSLLSGAGADDTEVEIQISGRVTAKVGGTNWAAARSSCGVAVMADTTGANRRLIAAADGAQGVVGRIISDVATDLAAASATAEVILFGWGSSVGSVGA